MKGIVLSILIALVLVFAGCAVPQVATVTPVATTTWVATTLVPTLVASPSPFGENLLQNSNAHGIEPWRVLGEARVGVDPSGSTCFELRNKGCLVQDVSIPSSAAGAYAVLIGYASTERVGQTITGLPYLYGYMISKGQIGYLQGQHMLCDATEVDEFVRVYGVFKIPSGTDTIRFFLCQAERVGDPQNGSAARFKNPGLFIFESEHEASTFVLNY